MFDISEIQLQHFNYIQPNLKYLNKKFRTVNINDNKRLKMFKVLISQTCQKIINLPASNICCRTLLSEAYKCSTSWNNRLSSPIFQKVDPDKLYYELENNFGPNGKATAIDVDIYANSVNNIDHLDSLADLLHKLRLSRETSNTLDSTSHAVIRIFHDLGEHNELLTILNDRINYGIFLDPFTSNILLDHFIESKDFTSAAKIASMLMLQEDFTNDINKSLSLHACLQYIQNPTPFEPIVEEPVVKETKPQGKKKQEEIRVRVRFLRNEFFDDHFDLRDGHLLVGKTLHMIGQNLGMNKIGNSCSLLGLVLHKKFEKAQEFIQTIDKNSIYDEARDSINTALNTVEINESNQQLIDSLKKSVQVLSGGCGLYENVETMVKDSIAKQEPLDITEQEKVNKNNKLQ